MSSIIGVGSDIVENQRIERILASFQSRFIKRILTPPEEAIFHQQIHQVAYLAKRFAAKEACVKALGTGFSQGISFQDIMVLSEHNQKPYLRLKNKAQALATTLGIGAWHLSLSDERAYSLAFVIASR